jgi:hypothetical protein
MTENTNEEKPAPPADSRPEPDTEQRVATGAAEPSDPDLAILAARAAPSSEATRLEFDPADEDTEFLAADKRGRERPDRSRVHPGTQSTVPRAIVQSTRCGRRPPRRDEASGSSGATPPSVRPPSSIRATGAGETAPAQSGRWFGRRHDGNWYGGIWTGSRRAR